MHRTSVITCVAILVAICVGAAALLATVGRRPGPAPALRARLTLASAHLGSDAGAPTGLPSRHRQETVLAGAYHRMTRDRKLAGHTPGPRDITDYGIEKTWSEGIDGAGTTVAVLEGWNDPSITQSIRRFDTPLGLPNPRITTIYPSGHHKLPATCPHGMVELGHYGSCRAWASETALDVAAVHLMAPYAKIVIAVAPPDSQTTEDAASQVAPPEMMQALETISRHHLANVVSVSDGTGEVTYRHGRAEVTAQDPGELAAAAAGIPFLGGTGDCGPVQNLATAGAQCVKTSRRPGIATWDDSPWTLAIGGSTPSLSEAGRRVPTTQVDGDQLPFAPGAGFSSIFPRPGYQSGVASVTHSPMRSVPDITMDFGAFTSGATPLMAGVLALATQANGGRNIGPINPVLYDVLGPRGAADGIADVAHGDNSVTSLPTDGSRHTPGFRAHKGFDVATGWGTIDAPRFIPALVRATAADHEERAARAAAATDLAALRHAVHLSPAAVQGARSSQLTATGFLPHHPVELSVDGRRIATLHADDRGDVGDTLELGRLHLPAGAHTVTLTSMLITETGQLTTH